ncbi:hypothetical protein VD0002_g7755 [Verticillium dahliae]|nr:hypothetical protein VD0002_g7755 [Verticillium dahliae]
MSAANVPLEATWQGHVASTLDAVVLFEACLSGNLRHVPRRPHDRERQDLIQSGQIFIYEEHASGIKRWTDGVTWSPSRILGNYLIYRELERPFPPGEKKRAAKKNKKQTNGGISKSEGCLRQNTGMNGTATGANAANLSSAGSMDPSEASRNPERALIGSLVDSYPFKEGGLVKKTISVQFRSVPHHLVSYYTVQDVMSGALATPTSHSGFLRNIVPRPELILNQNFRAPIDEVDVDDNRLIQHPLSSAHQEYVNHMHPPTFRTWSVPHVNMAVANPRQWPTSMVPAQQQQMPPPQHAQYLQTHPGAMAAPMPPPNYAQPSTHHPYAYQDGVMRPQVTTSSTLAPDVYRNMLVAQPLSRRHSTAYDLSNSSHAIGLTQTMSNNPVDPIRNMSHPFMQATPVYGNSGRLQEPVQHSDAFPSPRTLPQQEPGLDGSQQHSASLKLEGEESHLQHNNSWGTYDVAATHDVFLGGTNTDQSQPFLNPEGEEEQYDENNPPPTWPPGSNNSMGRL